MSEDVGIKALLFPGQRDATHAQITPELLGTCLGTKDYSETISLQRKSVGKKRPKRPKRQGQALWTICTVPLGANVSMLRSSGNLPTSGHG
jgi:hypothetical protein